MPEFEQDPELEAQKFEVELELADETEKYMGRLRELGIGKDLGNAELQEKLIFLNTDLVHFTATPEQKQLLLRMIDELIDNLDSTLLEVNEDMAADMQVLEPQEEMPHVVELLDKAQSVSARTGDDNFLNLMNMWLRARLAIIQHRDPERGLPLAMLGHTLNTGMHAVFSEAELPSRYREMITEDKLADWQRQKEEYDSGLHDAALEEEARKARQEAGVTEFTADFDVFMQAQKDKEEMKRALEQYFKEYPEPEKFAVQLFENLP